MKRTAILRHSILSLLLASPSLAGATPTPTGPTPTAMPPSDDTPTAIPDTPTAAPGTPSAAPATPTAAPPTPTAAAGTPTTAAGTPTVAAGTPTTAPGTPTAASGTPTTAPATPTALPGPGYPQIGEVIATELYIDSPGTDDLEFIEFKNRSDNPLRLTDCYLVDSNADSSTECSGLPGVLGNCDKIDPVEGAPLTIDGGAYAVFSIKDDIAELCGVEQTYDYTTAISLANTKAETFALHCPDGQGGFNEIFAIDYEWDQVDGYDAGLTWSLDPAHEDEASDGSHWCASQSLPENRFCGDGDDASYGSPGAANPACPESTPTPTATPTDTPASVTGSPSPTPSDTPVAPTPALAAPAPGEVYLTELSAVPNGGDNFEYFEFYNQSDGPRSFAGCVLVEASSDATTLCDRGGLENIVGDCDLLENKDGPLQVESEGYLLLSRSATFTESCGLDPAYDYTNGLSLPSNKVETVSLYCPVDGEQQLITQFTYDWRDADGEKGQSFQLDGNFDGDPLDAEQWCATEAIPEHNFCTTESGPEYGSPGAPNPECPIFVVTPSDTPPTPSASQTPPVITPPADCVLPKPGDVIFTELMIDAPGSSSEERLEFMELYNRQDEALCLSNCVLVENTLGSESQSCDELDGVFGACDTVGESGDEVYLLGQSHILLTQTPDIEEVCGLDLIDFDYLNSLSLPNTSAAEVALYCPNPDGIQTLIAQVTYDWKAAQGESGQSLTLDPEKYDAPTDPESWCPVPLEAESNFCTTEAGMAYGSPGTFGPNCPPPPPKPGDLQLVFTEIMVAPIPSTFDQNAGLKAHEWFEWVNLSDEDAFLNGCHLEVGKTETEGSDEHNPSTFFFPASYEAHVPGGARQVLADDGCLATDADGLCLDVTQGRVEVGLFDKLSFSNSSEQYLSLYCPSDDETPRLIDRIVFNLDGQEGLYGRTLQLQDNQVFAESNDDTHTWCPAPLIDELIYINSTSGPNWGSPGEGSVCDSDDVIPTDDEDRCGCSCRLDNSAQNPKDIAGAFMLMALGFIALTRRPRH